MKKLINILLIVAIFFVCTQGVFAETGINKKVNFQGKVVNKGVGATDGTNVTDGNYDFKFTLWDTLSAGSSLWTETWNSGTTQVSVSSGIFMVALGTYTTLGAVDFNNPSIYLSVEYNHDGDMSPRIPMAAVPFAFNAERVNGLTVTNTTGTLTIPNGKIVTFADSFVTTGVGISLNQSLRTTDSPTFVTATFSNVPVGTGTTILYINASGNLVQGTLPAGGQTYTATNGLNLAGAAFGLGGTLTQNTQIGMSGFDLSFVGVGGSSVLGVTSSGNIGVGTTGPGYKLEVVGNAMVSQKLGVGGTGTKAFNVVTDANIGTNLSIGGSLTLTAIASGVGTTVLFIDGSGNITSGTLPPGGYGKSRTMTLSPEYFGASLTADGSGTTSVSMTSDNTLNAGGVGWKNYYQLSSTEASLQDYTVVVRVALPSDFSTWETGSCPGSTCALEFAYQTGVGTTADNYVSYLVNNDSDTPGSAVCSIGQTANTAWGSAGCTSTVLGGTPHWNTAGQTAVVRIKMAAKNTASALTRAGDIILRYKSGF